MLFEGDMGFVSLFLFFCVSFSSSKVCVGVGVFVIRGRVLIVWENVVVECILFSGRDGSGRRWCSGWL